VHSWALKTLGNTLIYAPKGYIHIQFDGKGRVSGYGGCNSVSGSYAISGTQLSFSDLTSTLLWCDYGDLESNFMEALRQTNNYTVNNSLLSLYHGSELKATLDMEQ